MLKVSEVDLSQLQPWEKNPRLNDQAVAAVVRSIRAFGFNVPILCDQNLKIVAGHTRWKAAKELGMKNIPVIMLEMTETQRQAFSIADNKTAEIADWDFPKLRELLEDLKDKDIDLADIGYSSAELMAILAEEEEPDWGEFESRLVTEAGESYAILPIKIPQKAKEPLQNAIDAYARGIGIRGRDKAIVAGKALQKLLGVENG